MGVLVDNVEMVSEYFSGGWWHVIHVSRGGNAALHTGIAWPVSAPHDDTGEMGALIDTAGDGETAFGEAVGDLTTQTDGPFAGVVPATWWSNLSEGRKSAVHAQAVAWANAGKCP